MRPILHPRRARKKAIEAGPFGTFRRMGPTTRLGHALREPCGFARSRRLRRPLPCPARRRSGMQGGAGSRRMGLQIPVTLCRDGDDAAHALGGVPGIDERRDDLVRLESQRVAVRAAAQSIELLVGQARHRLRKTRSRSRAAARQRALLGGSRREDVVARRRHGHSRIASLVDTVEVSVASSAPSEGCATTSMSGTSRTRWAQGTLVDACR